MARVYVSIGSNIEREANIRGGVAELQNYFGELALSRVYESEAVGFDGDNFFNLVAAFDTDEEVLAVARIIHEIENDHGRTREGPRFSSRTTYLAYRAAKREIHRRFTSDQKLGNIFYLSGRRPKLRKPVRRFIDQALAAFPRNDAEVTPRSIRTRIENLAARTFGPQKGEIKWGRRD